jgi:hypothetical protein
VLEPEECNRGAEGGIVAHRFFDMGDGIGAETLRGTLPRLIWGVNSSDSEEEETKKR